MKTQYMDLDQILNMQKWQHLQNSLATSTQMAIVIVDYKGNSVTKHSAPRPFCEYIRANPDLEQFCQKCDSRGGLEATRLNAPYIYRCHCNIVDIAIPIMIDGKYIGAIMAGQIRLSSEEESRDLEQILISPNKTWANSPEAILLYEQIPILSMQAIEQATQIIDALCSYIVEESMNKNLLLETYEQIIYYNDTKFNPHDISGYSKNNIEKAKKSMNKALTNAYITTDSNHQIQCKNAILSPALAYIQEHKRENITLNQMAELCHISTSHFSRIFTREVGEGFSNFLSRQKIEWAKQFLDNTNLSISQISEELGFCDPGYFIKIFKKYEKITPAVYRKYNIMPSQNLYF